MATLKIEGLDKLFAKLDRLEARRVLMEPMEISVAYVHDHIGNYSRVAPPEVPTYKRGYGPVNRRGYVIRETSERLGTSWTHKVRMTGSGVVGEVGNDTSYGPYVQSADRQAWFHRMRGWKTDAQIIEMDKAFILEQFRRSIVRALMGR